MNNDRFKFRVWDTIDKTYDYNFPFNAVGAFYVREDGHLCSDYGNTVCPEFKQDRFIIEQCTGLKDKNGTLIYEGDIVSINGVGGVITWLESQAAFCAKSDSDAEYSMDFCPFEIIGNVHTGVSDE